MAESYATTQWIQFFRRAGLPTNVAANYAIIFSDNRIQLNMLMDLSKEYLYDMGIKVMGDVIAILRHAKEFHNQLAKDKVMEDISVPSSTPKKTSAATRILGHYTRPVSNPTEPTLFEKNKHLVSFSDQQMAQKSKMIFVKKKREEANAIYAKKARRVLPEEEGAYRIKMPLGNTERSRKILQQQQKLQQATKGSVFARLGDSAVSSSTDVDKSKASSVFNRLGPSNNHGNEVSTSSSFVRRVADTNSALPLQYQGVLKGTATVNKSIAANFQSGALVKVIDSQSKSRLLKRLGPKPSAMAIVGVSGVKRTVLNKSSSSTTCGVVRIKKIVPKASIPPSNSTHRIKTGSQGILGTNSALYTKLSVKSRLGHPGEPRYVQRVRAPETVEAFKEAAIDRLGNKATLSRTVFQRLGQ